MGHNADTPLYRKIADALNAKIEAGDFNYETPICTEKSICEEYGVSRITAKRAIEDLERENILYRRRGVGSFVSPMEKRANESLRLVLPGDGAGRRTVGLMIPFNITQGGIFAAIERVTTALSEANCSLALNIYEPGQDNERAMLKSMYSHGTDGVIYYPSASFFPFEELERLHGAGVPVVIMDKPHQDARFSSVLCDNGGGSYRLTEHLISYGHRKICYLSRYATDEVSSIRERYDGARRCFRDKGFTGGPRFELAAHYGGGKLDYPMLKHLVSGLRWDGYTAIECENDEIAFHVYMCCRNLNIRVPEDMSITGFDNINWATTGSAQITTADQNFSKIGQAVSELLLLPNYKPSHHVIPVRLVPRNSTGTVKL